MLELTEAGIVLVHEIYTIAILVPREQLKNRCLCEAFGQFFV